MHVTAKVSGYHPATGLNLVKGEEYTIDPAAFSDHIFQKRGDKTAVTDSRSPVPGPQNTDEGGN